jgi:drug/metabolite transporter (DMT)-like permease
VSGRQAALLGLLAALWGSSYLLIKVALDGFSPAEVVFGRAAIGAVVLVAACAAQGGGARAGLGDLRRRPLTGLGLGALFVAVPFLLISYGELHVPSGLTAVLVAPSPIFVALLAPLLGRGERLRARGWAGLGAGLAGVALVVGVETIGTTDQLLGALGILAASACYAGGSYLVKRRYAGVPPMATSAIGLVTASVLTLVPAIVTARHATPSAGAAVALVALAVANTALAFVIFYKLIGEIGAGRANLVSYLTPPMALAYGAVLYDEAIGPAAVAGLVLILLGVALASRGGEPGPARVPAPEGAETLSP